MISNWSIRWLEMVSNYCKWGVVNDGSWIWLPKSNRVLTYPILKDGWISALVVSRVGNNSLTSGDFVAISKPPLGRLTPATSWLFELLLPPCAALIDCSTLCLTTSDWLTRWKVALALADVVDDGEVGVFILNPKCTKRDKRTGWSADS